MEIKQSDIKTLVSSAITGAFANPTVGARLQSSYDIGNYIQEIIIGVEQGLSYAGVAIFEDD